MIQTNESPIVYIRSCRTAFARDGHPALSCQPNLTVEANRFGPGKAWEEWVLEPTTSVRGQECVALRSRWKGKYLSAKKDGQVRADAHSVGENESWLVGYHFHDGKDCVSFKSCRFGRYLVCDDLFDCGKRVRADRHEANE